MNHFLNFTIFPVEESKKIHSLLEGHNEKALFIIVNTDNNAIEHLELLEKILGAIQYNLNQDCHLLKMTPKTSFKFVDLAKKGEIKNVLSFGIAPKNLGLMHKVDLYQFSLIQDAHFLFAHDLNQLAADKNLKGALWNALKAKFLTS